VERTQQRLQGKTNVRIERLTFPVGPFDLVVCSDVLNYLSDRDLPQAIRLLAGLVRPGGSLLALHYLGDAGASYKGWEGSQSTPSATVRLYLWSF
jgi:hypothetical protein